MQADQTLFNILVSVCGVLFGIVVSMGRDEMKALRKKVDDQEKELGRIQTQAARDYVTREELQQTVDRVNLNINNQFQNMSRSLQRIDDKLDGKVDK